MGRGNLNSSYLHGGEDEHNRNLLLEKFWQVSFPNEKFVNERLYFLNETYEQVRENRLWE
jgi:hypothetical protein